VEELKFLYKIRNANNSDILNKIAMFFSFNNISIFSCCYNVVKLQVIIISVKLPEECNNHHNVKDLKYNLVLWILTGELTQVHLYFSSNQHLLPTLPYVKEIICRLGNVYFK